MTGTASPASSPRGTSSSSRPHASAVAPQVAEVADHERPARGPDLGPG